MRARNLLFKRYSPILMLLVFSATMLWGITTTFIKSTALANVVLHPDELKIVQVTDVHYSGSCINVGPRMLKHSGELLEDAVSQINNMKDVDIVVFSGDSVNSPSKKDLITFARIANKLKYPWYNTLGNHEVGIAGGMTKEKYFQILEAINLNYSSLTLRDMAFKPYYLITPKKDYKVIFLDGVIDDKISSNGQFSEKQLAWLDEKLTHYSDKKIVIVQHFPVVEPIKSRTHRVLNAQQYLDILDKHNNVVAVLAGHYHCSKVVNRNNVLHITTPALIQYPNAFRVITISEDCGKTNVKIETVETGLKDVQEKSRQSSSRVAANFSDGSGKSQNKVFCLSK